MSPDRPQDVEAFAPQPPHAQSLRDLLASDDSFEWTDWNAIPIVSTFGQPQAEYAAIRKAAALMDWPQRAFIEFTGADRLSFLNNLLTNALVDLKTKASLTAGHGCCAFFLNLKGRIVADVRVLEIGQNRTLLECDRQAAAMLAEAMDRYRFAEKVTMRARDDLHVLSLHGPQTPALLAEAADTAPRFEPPPSDFPATRDLPVARFMIGGVDVLAWREHLCAVPGVHLIVDEVLVARLWSDLMARFGQAADAQQFARRRLRPVGWAMFNACRIEAGLPMLGIDFAAAPPSRPGQRADQVPDAKGGTLPAETGPLFEKAVSTTGGCYLGQEVVARMHARNVVARKIVGIRMDEDALPSAGAEVEVDGQLAGVITSSTLSPVLSNACIALAMIKRPHFETGGRVMVPAEGRRAAGTIVELPMLAYAGAHD